MLNRLELARSLAQCIDALFIQPDNYTQELYAAWQIICNDPTFAYKSRAASAPWPVPSWQEQLSIIHPIAQQSESYRVIAVDGSQIYPDRHHNIGCFLINTGTVLLEYGTPRGSSALFHSFPQVLSIPHDADSSMPPTEYVNGVRQELELRFGAQLVKEYAAAQPATLLLFDGSLIFWHLEAQAAAAKDLFLSKYLATLYELYQGNHWCASYISMPKSKELINLIRLHLCDFNTTNYEETVITQHAVDATLASLILQPGERTIVFKNHSSVSAAYPDSVHPHFFYINVGAEIGRVEIPAYLAQQAGVVDTIAALVYNQAIKGGGYPVALAEAHEQAVVKGADRDFFFHLLQKASIEKKQQVRHSSKSMKKQLMRM